MLTEAHRAALSTKLQEAGLADIAEPVLAGAYSNVKLIPESASGARAIGSTKFAGDPELPIDCPWLDEISDLVFLLQIDLSQMPGSSGLGLPTNGRLYFFSQEEPQDGPVYYVPGEPALRPFKMPPPREDYIFGKMRPTYLKGVPSIDLPEYGSYEFSLIADLGREAEYTEFSQAWPWDRKHYAQLLGLPPGLDRDLPSEAAEQFGGEPAEWISLARVFSSWQSGLVLGDSNVLHYVIRRTDLNLLNFTRILCQTDGA
jgi:hypothetical protein